MSDFFSISILIAPLLACALVALAIVLERLWVLRMGVLVPHSQLVYLYDTIARPDALGYFSQSNDNNPLQRLLMAALASEGGGIQVMRNALRFEGELLAHELQRFLSLLGSIAMIAPLLGLLGTVLGLIDAFTALLQQPGQAQLSSQLSQGIAEALITTALGLCIAIPAVFCHRLLQRRVYSLVIEMEKHAMQLIQEYRPRRR